MSDIKIILTVLKQLDVLLQSAVEDDHHQFYIDNGYILSNNYESLRQHFKMLQSILTRGELDAVSQFASLAA